MDTIHEIAGMKFRSVYERQMADDVPLLVEKSLLLSDYYLRGLMRDIICFSAFLVLVSLIFDLSQSLNGQPIPSIDETIHALWPFFIPYLMMMFGMRQIFSSKEPLKYRIEKIG